MIRNANLPDCEPLGRLWLDFLNEQASIDDSLRVSDDAIERWHNDYPAWIDRDRRHIIVAEEDGELVGFAAAVRWAPQPVFSFAKEIFIEEFYVVPERRGEGIARGLYSDMISWAESWGAQRVRLAVLVANESARQFWKDAGLAELSVTMGADLRPVNVQPEEGEKARIGFGV